MSEVPGNPDPDALLDVELIINHCTVRNEQGRELPPEVIRDFLQGKRLIELNKAFLAMVRHVMAEAPSDEQIELFRRGCEEATQDDAE